VAGNNQVWGRADGGSASFFPLKVKVVDANGTPAAGVEVGFRIGSAPDGMIVGFITSSGRSFAISTTDANGIATLDGMVAHGNTGPFTVLVYTVGGSMNPAIFNETVSS
jgi:hypothetical protein